MTTANVAYVGSLGRTDGLDGDSWFTPEKYLNAVKTAFKTSIDLDPFSNEQANKNVSAKTYYTIQDDGFSKKWKGKNVFINPPYSRGLVKKAIAKALEEYNNQNIKNVIILTNNATDTSWYSSLAPKASRICFTNHRIKFWNIDGKTVSGNTRGQIFFLLSKDKSVQERFVENFKQFGNIYGAIL